MRMPTGGLGGQTGALVRFVGGISEFAVGGGNQTVVIGSGSSKNSDMAGGEVGDLYVNQGLLRRVWEEARGPVTAFRR